MSDTEEVLTFERVARWANANARAVPTLEYLHDLTRRAVEAEAAVDRLDSELTEALADYAHDSKTWRTNYKKVVAEAEAAELAYEKATLKWQRMEEVLCFFASVIKSREPWTDKCQQALDAALGAEPVGAGASEVEALRSLLRRLLQWDHLDGSADGPYWRREINAALAAEPSEHAKQATEVFASAVKEAVERHVREGRMGYRDGRLVILGTESKVCDCCGRGPDECPLVAGASATCAGGDCACFRQEGKK